jgi:hypothetical protein
MESIPVLNAVVLLAVAALAVSSLAILLFLSRRERRAREGFDRERARAEALLERAWRLRDLDRILREDPMGRSIDPEREPTLHRIFLLRHRGLTSAQFAARADREAALDRLAADLAELRTLFEGDRTEFRDAWRRRFGEEPGPGDLERLMAHLPGESAA